MSESADLPKIDIAKTDNRAFIYVGDDYRTYQASEKAQTVLVGKNDPPTVFVRGDVLAYIGTDKDSKEPIIKIITEDTLTTILHRICSFYVVKKVNGESKKITRSPPREVIKDFLHNISKNKFKGIPLLHGITQCPIINFKGEIQTIAGYNEEFKLVYISNETLEISVPDHPTDDDIKKSTAVLEDLLVDFPFCDQKDIHGNIDGKASKANMMGTLIASAVPALLNDILQPMITITKPTQGTGSSFLCRISHIIQTGMEPHMLEMPVKREEWSKLLLSCAIEGWTSMIFDNVDNVLYSPELAMAITQIYQSGRILGVSQTARIKFTPKWMANGINITLSGDMPRRCVVINLDAGIEMPWLRDKFTHEDIIEYTKENRNKIISAILTIVRAWIQKGCPEPNKKIPQLQGFNEWRYLIGGILSIMPTREDPIDGETPTHGWYFLTNLMDMYQKADVGRGQWAEFMSEWHKKWGSDRWLNLSDVVRAIESSDAFDKELRYCLPEEVTNSVASGKDISRALGRALHKQMDRVYRIDIPAVDGGVLMTFENRKLDNKSQWKLMEKVEKKKDPKVG